jgi:arginine/lysine/ornithine decarboxylase
VQTLDPWRLTVVVDKGLGMSGLQLDDVLHREHGVCAEMSTQKVPRVLLTSCCALQEMLAMGSFKRVMLPSERRG